MRLSSVAIIAVAAFVQICMAKSLHKARLVDTNEVAKRQTSTGDVQEDASAYYDGDRFWKE